MNNLDYMLERNEDFAGGHAHERAAHLIGDTLHGAIASANLACDRFRILPGRIFGKFFSTAAKLVKFLGDASDAAHQIGSAVGIAGVFIEELVRVIEVAHQVSPTLSKPCGHCFSPAH